MSATLQARPPRNQPAAAAPLKPASPQEVDKAIEKALEYLKKTQSPDGSWQSHAAYTSLSVMAFLSAGHVPGEGRFGDVVEKGVRWVMQRQLPNGLITAGAGAEMYQHGISTIMLSEVVGMTDGKLAEEIRPKLEKAVVVILQAQRNNRTITHRTHDPNRGMKAELVEDSQFNGGWHYTIVGDTADLSCTGWQIMALRAAKNVGCDVPPECIDRAVNYVKRSQEEGGGGFHYAGPNSAPTTPCTATGILCLELCDSKNRNHSPEAISAGEALIKAPLRWGEGFFAYRVYYTSQATFQLGGKYWEAFRPQLHHVLLSNQGADGSWNCDGHPNYCTAMAILALTVEYRYLPIYQRGEEPTDK